MIAIILYVFVCGLIYYGYLKDEETNDVAYVIVAFIASLVVGWITVPIELGQILVNVRYRRDKKDF